MNEFTLGKKLVIIVLIINIFSILFATFLGSGASQSNNPTFTTLNNTETEVVTTTNNLVNSFNNPPAIITPNPGNTGLFGGIINVMCYIAIFFYGLINLIINGILLLATSIFIVIFMLFVLIPSLFNGSAFGQFASLFGLIYGASLLISILYGIYLLEEMVRAWIPGLHAKPKGD